MVKKLLPLILITVITTLFSAEFKVKSFKQAQTDITAIQRKVLDDNGERTGIVKIMSDEAEGMIVFANRGVVITDKNHPGEFWVFLSPGEKMIKISKKGFIPLDYVLPKKIESDKVYILTLNAIGRGGDLLDTGLNRVTFKLNEPNVYISKGSTAPIKANGKTAVFKVPKEEKIEFRFSKAGFIDIEKTIVSDKDKIIDITLKRGDSSTKLKLPGIIVINSDPIGAEIYLNDQKYSVTPFSDKLIAGDYTLKIRKDLYHTHSSKFTIEEGETKELPTIKLNPNFGFYTIKATPEKARLYLDGISIENTQNQEIRIGSGEHIFKAEYDLYHSEEKTVIINDGDRKEVVFDLKKNYGEVEINSEPEGAFVYLNNKKVGTTPFRSDKIKSGKYTVNLTKPLWADVSETIVVKDGEVTEKQFLLNKNFGSVIIKTLKDADIYVNGEKVGTSFYEKNMDPGKYKIVTKKDKHRDSEREIFVNIGRSQEIEVNPEPIMGSLSIFSSPLETKGSEIFLNKTNSGKKTPAVLPLLVGDYEVTLKHPDFLESTQSITLVEGENKEINFKLKTYEGSRKESRDFWNTQKWIALGSFIASIGAGSYFYAEGENLYSDYENASTVSKASSLYKDVESADNYRNISFTVSIVPLGYFFYSWYKESSYE